MAIPIIALFKGEYKIVYFYAYLGLTVFIMMKADIKFGKGASALVFLVMMILACFISDYYSNYKSVSNHYTNIPKYNTYSESTSSPKIKNYGLKPKNDVTNSNDNPVTVPNQNSEIYEELFGNKAKEQQREVTETPKINTPKTNTSPVPSVPVYNPEHYIGIYHIGYAAYVLIDSIKPMKCTVKAIGECNIYYIYYDFSFVNNEWHFHNSQGFDGLVTDETPIEKNIINFCKSIDWKPVKTQNINSLYDDSNDLQAAKNKLQEFHINITNKLYRQAYDCLSEAFQ